MERFLKIFVQSSTSDVVSHGHRPVEIKTEAEIEILRQAGRAVALVLDKVVSSLSAGVSTKYLDDVASKEIGSLGMKSAFLDYRGYPATACISINHELVHGIPKADRIIKEGDIVSIDLGVKHNGFFGDMAVTAGVGKISREASKILAITRDSLNAAIEQVRPGNRLGDISWAIQNFAESRGYSVVRDYVGHGIGRELHEEPQVPNFGRPGTGIRLAQGMVFCIEPMINLGGWEVKTLRDNWTVVTLDGKLCAHFEHMVAVTEKGCEVLTKI